MVKQDYQGLAEELIAFAVSADKSQKVDEVRMFTVIEELNQS